MAIRKISSRSLGDTTVSTVDIAADAITSAKILDGEVTADDLASTLDLSGKTITLPPGVGGIDWSSSVQTSNFTAVSAKGYFVNTTSAAITVTMPSSPSQGDYVVIVDYAGTANTNNITINGNGAKFDGQDSIYPMVLTGNNIGVSLVYIDSTQGWKVYSSSREDTGTSYISTGFDNLNPYLTYGDGSDGDVTTLSPNVNTWITDNSVSSGATTFNIASNTGFSVGDLILIIQVQDSGLTIGRHEYQRVAAVNSLQWTVESPLQNSYVSNNQNNASDPESCMIYRVPEYNNVTLTSTTITASAWDGFEGGVIPIFVKGTLTLNATTLDVSDKGFRGVPSQSTSNDGDNYAGEGTSRYLEKNRTGYNGAGGGGRQNTPGSTSQGAGGGGGHGTAGSDGTGGNYGFGGVTWGAQDLTTHLGFGGAGGAAGYDYSTPGGAGAAGGGIIMINAETITMSNSSLIDANGENQYSGATYGGAGAGGSIFINCDTITDTDGTCTIRADAGSSVASGAGGAGRIHIKGTQSGIGTISPTAYTG
jgi:hypothetical protein